MLTWRRMNRLKGNAIAQAVAHRHALRIAAMVWDRARGYQAPDVQSLARLGMEQPPAAPDLNPAKRVVGEIHPAVEGRMDAILDENTAVVEQEAQDLARDQASAKRLAKRAWLRDGYAQ
jgi:hypothetical protein